MSTHVLQLHEIEAASWPARLARAACERARERRLRTVAVRPAGRQPEAPHHATATWAIARLASRV
jgi:hypothetical protein